MVLLDEVLPRYFRQGQARWLTQALTSAASCPPHGTGEQAQAGGAGEVDVERAAKVPPGVIQTGFADGDGFSFRSEGNILLSS